MPRRQASRDELDNAALIGLWQACLRWAGGDEDYFRKRATLRIRGAVIDFLRTREDWRTAKGNRLVLSLSAAAADDRDFSVEDRAEQRQAANEEAGEEVARLLKHLPAVERRVVELHALEEKTGAEVARLQGWASRSFVSMIYHRALRRMREAAQ